MGNLNKLSLTLIMMSLSSCATLTNREKTLISMGIGGVVGGLIGSATTPNDEKMSAHVILGAGVGATVVGVTSLFIFNDDQKLKEQERQINSLHDEVAALRGETDSNLQSKELFHRPSTLEKEVPKEYRGLVKPGGWSIYEVDQWVDGGNFVKIHQDKILKLEPAQLRAGSN